MPIGWVTMLDVHLICWMDSTLRSCRWARREGTESHRPMGALVAPAMPDLMRRFVTDDWRLNLRTDLSWSFPILPLGLRDGRSRNFGQTLLQALFLPASRLTSPPGPCCDLSLAGSGPASRAIFMNANRTASWKSGVEIVAVAHAGASTVDVDGGLMVHPAFIRRPSPSLSRAAAPSAGAD
ncbi:MAG: hypothetical protein KKC29_02330 [Alphaproteobacteria bacterium]|jgi:hypothetical protein|nr:hypothetical protein [Alphaproteobacteria bacterium]MBU2041166.1 hypothetical protein [Alphaproteobacteria bacterium]MBU2125529.1 hypothetical protein [Alphaproteobacteria bacterium]MBU2208512.1 hypothetical protein [Alphaproteobacteria bacterium]MBU2289923.1 hypothetical protein [Alphaproteobacteria bacterium]